MGALSDWFNALSERERRMVLAALAAAIVVLLVAVLLPFERRVSSLAAQVATKQADLEWLKSVAPQLAGLRATTSTGGNESLVALADRVARETGVARQLKSLPSDSGGLNVRMDQIPFDALVNWAGALTQRNGVHVVSATIDSGTVAGSVSATLVLQKP